MKNEKSNSDVVVLELSDGTQVELKECWDIAHGDSYSTTTIIRCEDISVICSFRGSLPDFDDEDFDMDEYVKKIEEEIDWHESY